MPTIRFFIKKTVGLEHIPRQGPFLLTCKHLGPMDGIFIAAVIVPIINQKVRFVTNIAKAGWFWEEIVAKRWAGCIPFYREAPKTCIDLALEYLQRGEVVGIFPEGLIQDFGTHEHRAKTGAARLAIWGQVPVVPVGLVHNISVRQDLPFLQRRRQVIKNILLNPHALEIHIGRPFELSEYYYQEMNKQLLVEASEKIIDQIDLLTTVHMENNTKSV